MTDSAELGGLLKRVRAAEGPDRSLDIDICVSLKQYAEADYERFGHHFPVGYYVAYLGIAPAYTSSLDAAIGLVERLDRSWTVVSIGGAYYRAEIHDRPPWVAEAKTAALALIAALLASLQEDQPHG